MRRIELPKNQIIEWYEQGMGCGKIAFLIGGCHEDTVRNRLKSWGVSMRDANAVGLLNSTKRCTKLTHQHQQIMNGLLLGDGGVYIHSRSRNAHFSTKSIHQMLADKFHKIGLSFHAWPNKSRKNQPILRASAITIPVFFEYIRPHFNMECFNYKWKLPEHTK